MCNLPEGQCLHVSIGCEDDDYCTQDFCDPASGCKHKLTAGCESCTSNAECPPPAGNLCVQGICDPASGKCSFVKKGCDDGDHCTDDYCVPETGECATYPACCEMDTDCDVGNQCSEAKCEAGHCTVVPKSCNDGNQCTLDSCDTDVGCVHEVLPGCTGQGPGA